MNLSASTLLHLLRVSLGTAAADGCDLSALSAKDWSDLIDLAFDHGVASLSVDAYSQLITGGGTCLLEKNETLEDLKFEWLGSVLQDEEDYKYKFQQTSRFAKLLRKKGVSCYVLKGLAFSTYYAHPEYRVSSDCDLHLRSESGDAWEIGNATALKIGGWLDSDSSSYKHSKLILGKLVIENHRYLTDFNGTRQGRKTELLLERALASEPGKTIRFSSDDVEKSEDSALICPNDHFNALFLLKHAHGNFLSEGLALRMIYDWAAFLLRCQESMDWPKLYADLEQCRLSKFADVMTSLCVDFLGIRLSRPEIRVCTDNALVEEIIDDTLFGGIHQKEGESLFGKCMRIAKRFVRMNHFRALATESVPRMIWNSFVFSSYFHRNIKL